MNNKIEDVLDLTREISIQDNEEIDFSINAYVPGMYVHLHAIGKWRD